MDAKQWVRSVEPTAAAGMPLPQVGGFRPCHHRSVTEDGRVVCAKVGRGDREVSAALCAACPAARLNCQHLRFTLEKDAPSTLVVRYGNGKTEVWQDDRPPQVRFARAACALLRVSLVNTSPCATCAYGQPLVPTATGEGDCPQPLETPTGTANEAPLQSEEATAVRENPEELPNPTARPAGRHQGRLIPFPSRLTRGEVHHESPD